MKQILWSCAGLLLALLALLGGFRLFYDFEYHKIRRMVLKCTFTQQIPVDSDLPLYLIIVRGLIFGETGGRLLVQI